MILGVIPLRIGSTRLPFKPLLELGGKPLFFWAAENALKSETIDKIIVAADSEKIIEKALSLKNVECILTPELPSGSDRVAWVARKYPSAEIVANIQGDEPFLNFRDIDKAVRALKEDPGADISTLFVAFSENDNPSSPSTVKIVADKNNYALYFSRAKIPFSRDGKPVNYLRHLGLYVYKKDFLLRFSNTPAGVLEDIEKLEQLRALEMGAKIKLVAAEKPSFGIDTEEDFIKAANLIKGENFNGK